MKLPAYAPNEPLNSTVDVKYQRPMPKSYFDLFKFHPFQQIGWDSSSYPDVRAVSGLGVMFGLDFTFLTNICPVLSHS
jgi:hypothetical protein